MSDNNSEIKLFISYCHLDENYVDEFRKHIAPLKNNGSIKDWYDRKITAGGDFQRAIDNNLEDADIICLFISANFLNSPACMEEKKQALHFRDSKGIIVVPIILSRCGWKDDDTLAALLALPTDGEPVSSFSNSDDGWNIVYTGLKGVLIKQKKIDQLEYSDDFLEFLHSVELLSKAHSQKTEVKLEDIFVWPDLSKFDAVREYDTRIGSEELVKNFHEYKNILIAGENQSGKTTLCKKIIIELRKKKYVPVYFSDESHQYHGKVENWLENAFHLQYKNIQLSDIDTSRIVPIIDDFHFAKNKDKHIDKLSKYPHHIIVVDDIFALNVRDETLIAKYNHYNIEEFNAIGRVALIKKWIHLSDHVNGIAKKGNMVYREIDEKYELVNSTLGKILGQGIMPSYPFFILAIISTYDVFAKPLDQEITSQGYCYQALIFLYLRKAGVSNNDIDTYINFLTELAYFLFSKKMKALADLNFRSFMDAYLSKYQLPVPQDQLLEKLRLSQLVSIDSFGNYHFCYQYIYFLFVAKYMAEHLQEQKEIIGEILNNLHKDENAYIAIFISHHSKSNEALDDLLLNAYCLFDKYKPATLSTEELKFFDIQEKIIIEAALPSSAETPETERTKRLKHESESENGPKLPNAESDDDKEIYLDKELRRAIKTVEVIGRIMKNRAGSLDKQRLYNFFEEAMNVHLRILNSFFDIIRGEEGQEEITNIIENEIQKIIKNQSDKRKSEGRKIVEPTKKQLKKISQTIFWNLNFLAMLGIVSKIISSLGSSKLTQIVEEVCNNINTPAAFLIKHGILMWYNKNLQIDEIAKEVKGDEFSSITIRIIKFFIVNHCSMHNIGFKDRQKIIRYFRIPTRKLLKCQDKDK